MRRSASGSSTPQPRPSAASYGAAYPRGDPGGEVLAAAWTPAGLLHANARLTDDEAAYVVMTPG